LKTGPWRLWTDVPDGLKNQRLGGGDEGNRVLVPAGCPFQQK
jgi:hypothetical protein